MILFRIKAENILSGKVKRRRVYWVCIEVLSGVARRVDEQHITLLAIACSGAEFADDEPPVAVLDLRARGLGVRNHRDDIAGICAAALIDFYRKDFSPLRHAWHLVRSGRNQLRDRHAVEFTNS